MVKGGYSEAFELLRARIGSPFHSVVKSKHADNHSFDISKRRLGSVLYFLNDLDVLEMTNGSASKNHTFSLVDVSREDLSEVETILKSLEDVENGGE